MNNLIIALVAWWFSEGSGLMQEAKFLTKWKGRCRPFDCPMCLALWLGLFIKFDYIDYSIDFYFSPLDAIICSAIAILISKVYYRL